MAPTVGRPPTLPLPCTPGCYRSSARPPHQGYCRRRAASCPAPSHRSSSSAAAGAPPSVLIYAAAAASSPPAWCYDYENTADEEEESEAIGGSFDTAVALFNGGEFHACHDVVEELWYTADEPNRTLLHAILQCAVAFHHLFNQNHRGAMMELGEGLRNLRLDDDDSTSPFSRFQEDVAAALNFIYRTQKELAACTDDLCLTMDGSATSYQLLGNFAAGRKLYRLETTTHAHSIPSIVFSAASDSRVKLPTLCATEQHLAALQCTHDECI